jgi:phosphonopyruvate decarboxylase
MIRAEQFLKEAKQRGFNFYTGVPCSFLTPLINRTISDRTTDYVGAASEGEAVAIAAGAWLAGRGTVVMCQNSGLGNTINPLTSLNWPFRIPTLLVSTWRGQPGLKDEPQHELMGRIMAGLLDTIEVPHAPFPDEETAIGPALDAAADDMARSSLPYAFIMAKGAVADETLDETPRSLPAPGIRFDRTVGGKRPMRYAAIERALATVGDDVAIVATTGFCGRELFTIADREQHLYQVGSMGCASAMGLGIATNVSRPVLVLDGDGAALMKMGNLATIGAGAPHNLVHLVLDNAVHDSTGGQATVSASVDLAGVALACGYATATATDNLDALEEALKRALNGPGPHMIHLRVAPGSIDNLGRPTIKPKDVALRFKDFLALDKPAS